MDFSDPSGRMPGVTAETPTLNNRDSSSANDDIHLQSGISSDKVIEIAQEILKSARNENEVATKSLAAGAESPEITMDMSHKNIQHIPDEFVDITKDHVGRLALSHNHIEDLPAKFSDYKVLRYLNIRNNGLRKIPIPVLDIESLEILDVGRNKIQELPHSIWRLSSLKVFAIQKNRITHLPMSLGEMDSLQLLKFEGNPLVFPPINLFDMAIGEGINDEVAGLRTTSAIRKYLREAVVLAGVGGQWSSTEINSMGQIDQEELIKKDSPPRGVPTDSGYASGRYGNSTHVQSSTAGTLDGARVQSQLRPEADDSATIYSDSSSLLPAEQGDYIVDLAIELLRHVQVGQPDAEAMRRVSNILPDLLRDFALKLGYNAPSQLHRDVMFFIHKNRRKIADVFEKQRSLEEELEEETTTKSEESSDDVMSPNEKMSFWRERSEYPENEQFDVPPAHDDIDDIEDDTMKHSIYRDFILKAPAYDWLRATLRREATLDLSQAKFFNKIKETISQALSPNRKVSRRASSKEARAIFTVDWNLLGFLEQQSYEKNSQDILERVITLTSMTNGSEESINNVQVLTCQQYLCQTWPSTWKHLLSSLQKLIYHNHEDISSTSTNENSIIMPSSDDHVEGTTTPPTYRQKPVESKHGFVDEGERDGIDFTKESPAWDGDDDLREDEMNALHQIRLTRRAQKRRVNECEERSRATSDDVLNAAPNSASRNLQAVELPDGSKLKAYIPRNTKTIRVGVAGSADFVIEIGEQLAWLGAALRYSLHDSGLCLCFPDIKVVSNSLDLPNFRIEYATKELPLADKYPNGQCWRNMFRSPVLVGGYPIRRKSESHPGIEIPLNIMTALAGADRVNEFNGCTFIKGFSAMLVAVQHTRDFIVWHYLFNEAGDRISYLAHQGHTKGRVSTSSLEHARHIVGWCSDAKFYTGAADAKLNIQRSRLDSPSSGMLLEKVSISAGKIVSAGASFAIGVKDLPIHVSRQGYIPKLKWVAQKYVLLWDEETKRGWLVNGTSALLHIVRASLERDMKDEFASSCLFDPTRMKDADVKHKPNSAIPVLKDNRNMELKIYPEKDERYGEETRREDASLEEVLKRKTTYYRFHDRVEHHFSNLEQMIDHQARVAGTNGVNMKVRVRKSLEGWDFVDLISDCDLHPKVATLHAYGYGWVDFIRSIQAPVLFGRGFGDLIQPAETASPCDQWRLVPGGKYYMTTSVWDLQRIIDMYGDIGTKPLKICQELVWNCSDEIFKSCQCRRRSVRDIFQGKAGKHRDPVQTLLPTKSRHILPATNRFDPQEHEGGAIIWGHSVNFSFNWGETGDPVPGKLRPPSKCSGGDEAVDSGIGSSLSSSGVKRAYSSRRSPVPIGSTNDDGLQPPSSQTIRRSDSDQQRRAGTIPEEYNGKENYFGPVPWERYRDQRRQKRRGDRR